MKRQPESLSEKVYALAPIEIIKNVFDMIREASISGSDSLTILSKFFYDYYFGTMIVFLYLYS